MASTLHNPISDHTVRKAVNALLKWKKLQSKKTTKPSISIEEDPEEELEFIYLTLTLKKIPPKELTAAPQRIPLPHPLHPLHSLSNLCLIIDDRPRKTQNGKSKISSEFLQKKIKSEDIPITKVLKLSKVKSEYNSFEEKRKLYDSYEMFLADKNVVHLLPKLLGKLFYRKKKKAPLPVELRDGGCSLKEEVEAACTSAFLSFGTGTCCAVKVGRGGVMEGNEIMENVRAAIDEIVKIVPKKWNGVRAFHLKFSDSLALPIYEALPDSNMNIEGEKQ